MATQKFQAQPADQPENLSDASQEPAQGKSPNDNGHDVIPVDKLNEIVTKSVTETLAAYERRQQSQRDKLEARISKQIEFLQKRGVDITPEVKQDVAAEIQAEIKSELDSQEHDPATKTGQSAGQGQSKGSAIEEAVNAELEKLDTQYGLTIEDSDPEAKELDNSSGFAFVRSYEKAIAAKKARIDGNGGRRTAPAYMGGGGNTPGDPLANITDPDLLWAAVKKKG